jgi:hypothetical protein
MKRATLYVCLFVASMSLVHGGRSLHATHSKNPAHRRASAPTHMSEPASTGAPAPTPLSEPASTGAPGPSPSEELPDFAGKPLTQPPSRKEKVPGDVPFPVNDANQLVDLTEKQLWSIFTRGVADNPSTLPGEQGKFALSFSFVRKNC